MFNFLFLYQPGLTGNGRASTAAMAAPQLATAAPRLAMAANQLATFGLYQRYSTMQLRLTAVKPSILYNSHLQLHNIISVV